MDCPRCAAPLSEDAAFCDTCGSGLPRDPLLGQVLRGEYRILGKLGEGGFGAVYPAEQIAFGRKVAIKTLHSHLCRSSTIVARFRREGVAASRLEHPATVKVYSSGETEDGVLWIAMELLEGKEGKFVAPNEARAAELFQEACRLVDFLLCLKGEDSCELQVFWRVSPKGFEVSMLELSPTLQTSGWPPARPSLIWVSLVRIRFYPTNASWQEPLTFCFQRTFAS